MLATIWAKIKAVLNWAWTWINVIVGCVIVAPTALIDGLNAIQAIDWSPFISTQKALAIQAVAALTKAIVASASAAYGAYKARQEG